MNLYIALVLPLLLLTLWYGAASVVRARFPPLRDRRILLLIAHPDDEAMFFAPTLLALTRPELNNTIEILCLSSGDAEGIGELRKTELLKSAALLGVVPAAVTIVEDAAFPDSARAWDADAIAGCLDARYGTPGGAARPDVVLTFDSAGVSGHPNHLSLYFGARAWLRALKAHGSDDGGGDGLAAGAGARVPAVYALTSTGMARKYLGLLDAPLTLAARALDGWRAPGRRPAAAAAGEGPRGSRAPGGGTSPEPPLLPQHLVFLSDMGQWRRAQTAMTRAHRSQLLWFRWGWIGLSRYMLVNDLRRVAV